MQLKPKSGGNAALMDQARDDWHRMIAIHPDRFDAVLYRASEQSVNAESGALFGDLDAKQNDIVYLDPEIVSAVESTGEDEFFMGSWDGEENAGYGGSGVILLRLSAPDVPEGSGIVFLVQLKNGQCQRQSWYVHSSEAYGSPAVGFVHRCIPWGDWELPYLPAVAELLTLEAAE